MRGQVWKNQLTENSSWYLLLLLNLLDSLIDSVIWKSTTNTYYGLIMFMDSNL